MREDFIQYIWKHRSFDQMDLRTTSNERIHITKTGYHNDDAGPDFLEASIRIGDVVWSGSVEMHIKSSQWYQHGHHQDPGYQNVILHVVWEHDKEVYHPDGQKIPCLIIKDFVSPSLLDKYKELSNQIADIPCQYSVNTVPTIIQKTMLEKAAVERLKSKADEVLSTFNNCHQDWEETCYRLTLAAFGMKVNKSPLVRLAELTPFKLIKKYANEPKKVSSLLFGQAGLLTDQADDFCKDLKETFEFLRHKHELKTSLHRPQWKFSRMRPANFPTIRIAQASAFLSQNPTLFNHLLASSSHAEIHRFFNGSVHQYWEEHYDFGKKRSKSTKTFLGKQMTNHLIINVFAPVLMAASIHFDETSHSDQALHLLENTSSESNKITRKLQNVGIQIDQAIDSQGALSLYYDYCLKKNCLQCNIGGTILRQ
jgi:hypothetical protein